MKIDNTSSIYPVTSAQRGSVNRIGESLIAEGLLKPEHVDQAINEQKNTKERLGDIIIKLGFLSPEQMGPFIAKYFRLPYTDLKNTYKSIHPQAVTKVPEDLARRFTVLPIDFSGDTLTIAMYDPLDVVAEDTIRIKTGLKVKRTVALEREIIQAIEYCYHQLPRLQEHIENFVDQNVQMSDEDDPLELLRVEASDPPVVKYVHHLVVQAVNNDASDIHIQPKQDSVELKFRIDSVLFDFDPPPKGMFSAIITRIKILSQLDIAERRLPQDGRFKIEVGGNDVDIRVSCFPTIYGESIVLRLLNTSSPLLGLEYLGMAPRDLTAYRNFIHRPYGLILVTGPTGSGKTTTLYTTLNEIKAAEKNIITLEDPVEYRLPFLQQSQVNPGIGFDFARGLRSILRQDPDVIMVGEIRDRETAEIAIHAALTGHLVFSTLHTNDSTGAAVRLINMGVEPFLISSSLLTVVAQRLVRRICPKCRTEQVLSDSVREKLSLGKEKLTVYKGAGCDHCLKRGYKGRVAVFEVLSVNEALRTLIASRASSDDIRRQAQAGGMKTLSESGIDKMKAGITSIEEVLRVTQEFEEIA